MLLKAFGVRLLDSQWLAKVAETFRYVSVSRLMGLISIKQAVAIT